MKQNHRFEVFALLLELYSGNTVEYLTENMTALIRHFKEGDIYWRKTRGEDSKRSDYKELLSWLQDVKRMAEDLPIVEDRCMVVQDEYVQLNVNPFCEFLEKHKPITCMLNTMTVQSYLVQNAHSATVEDMKTHFATTENLLHFFVCVNEEMENEKSCY
jgi:hypothetical protein